MLRPSIATSITPKPMGLTGLFGHLLGMLGLIAAIGLSAYAQQKPVGQFENHEDIGAPAKPGSVVYDAGRQTYTITASGVNMWADRDEFHYLWKRMKGNFILRARVEFLGKGVDPHRKIGWIARSNLDADSPHVNATVHG